MRSSLLAVVAASARALSADPFRPARPPLEPILINSIQDLLLSPERDPSQALKRMLEARKADPDYQLTERDVGIVTNRMLAVSGSFEPLMSLIHSCVDATPWVTKYGSEADFGVGDVADPYVRMKRAECMLGAFIMHVEDGDIDFLEEDRLEVLSRAPDEAVLRLRESFTLYDPSTSAEEKNSVPTIKL